MCLAIPGEVMSVYEKHGMRFGEVRFGGAHREVCLEYEPETTPGDFVLVHVGFAISRIDAERAAETWAVLEDLGELDELDDLAEGT